MKFLIPLEKALPIEDSDGVLTRYGMEVAHRYAVAWQRGERHVALEREFPAMVGLLYDIRQDPELAAEHALPF